MQPFKGSSIDPQVMLESYIETAIWSSIDNDDVPLDINYGRSDLSSEAELRMLADCVNFLVYLEESNIELIPNGYRNLDWVMSQVGHDFWLTRNGHGAGFWDGDWEQNSGRRLTEAAKTFGESNLYIGDNGEIYLL